MTITRSPKEIKSLLQKEKKIFLFFDYDGTLCPIVKKPELAKLSPKNKIFLKKLSKNKKIKIAIISGRSLEDVKKLVNIKNIIYAGNHGLEILGPKINPINPTAKKTISLIKKICAILKNETKHIKNCIIENKNFSASFHYRLVKATQTKKFKQIILETLRPLAKQNKIKITFGKKVIEARPPADWNKGKAVELLIKKLGKGYVPIYFGDDKTDEDAFRTLSKKGITIFVGKGKTGAKIKLENISAVYKLLAVFI